ncbi:hypothetical protein NC652_006270 [Populus alba x Populus x berolinensis]|nr:hypothetical protein NC652_006270 [Populus alba x Populus x berolinensis]
MGVLCLKFILLGDHEGGEAFLITYELLNIAGMFRFPLVSCTATSAENANLNPGVAGCLSAAQQSMAISSLGFSWLCSTRYVISPLSCVVQRCHAQLVKSNLVMCRVISLGIVSRLTSRAVHRTVLPCF